jgi:hypothetical protein
MKKKANILLFVFLSQDDLKTMYTTKKIEDNINVTGISESIYISTADELNILEEDF